MKNQTIITRSLVLNVFPLTVVLYVAVVIGKWVVLLIYRIQMDPFLAINVTSFTLMQGALRQLHTKCDQKTWLGMLYSGTWV